MNLKNYNEAKILSEYKEFGSDYHSEQSFWKNKVFKD